MPVGRHRPLSQNDLASSRARLRLRQNVRKHSRQVKFTPGVTPAGSRQAARLCLNGMQTRRIWCANTAYLMCKHGVFAVLPMPDGRHVHRLPMRKARFPCFTKSEIFKKNRPPKAVTKGGPLKGSALNQTIGEATRRAALHTRCRGRRLPRPRNHW